MRISVPAAACAALLVLGTANAADQVLKCETRNYRTYYRFSDGEFYHRAPNQESWSPAQCGQSYERSNGCNYISTCNRNGDRFYWEVIQMCGNRGSYTTTRINVGSGEFLLESDFGNGKNVTPGNCQDVTAESSDLPVQQAQPQQRAPSHSAPAYTYQPPPAYIPKPPAPIYRRPSNSSAAGVK